MPFGPSLFQKQKHKMVCVYTKEGENRELLRTEQAFYLDVTQKEECCIRIYSTVVRFKILI